MLATGFTITLSTVGNLLQKPMQVRSQDQRSLTEFAGFDPSIRDGFIDLGSAYPAISLASVTDRPSFSNALDIDISVSVREVS